MQLLTHFVTEDGAVGAMSLLPSRPIAPANHSYKATANRASKRTAWYSAFGAAATWSPIG
ncbi:MAG TPA: hypothetical protein VF307_08325 [Candidatus Nanopelagicaceae bacterium]